MFRDRVEPQLPQIEIIPIKTDGESGVIICRVGQSRLAPHRVTRTLVCPIRQSDRCEKMTMRQIQDLTLNISRGLERLKERLSERSERFQREFERIHEPEKSFGIRATAIPVGDEIRFDRVFRHRQIIKDLCEPWRTLQINPQIHNFHDIEPIYWRPILRGARAERYPEDNYTHKLSEHIYREIHCDGLIELGYLSGATELQGELWSFRISGYSTCSVYESDHSGPSYEKSSRYSYGGICR